MYSTFNNSSFRALITEVSSHRLAENPMQTYNVRFAFNRMMLRTQHRAVDNADIKLVWPEAPTDLRLIMQQQQTKQPSSPAAKSMADGISWFDKDVPNNPEQANAVKQMVNRHYGSKTPPMLLFGAFGTGKTRYAPMLLMQGFSL
jgi:chromosomal replication initiation ATPase DnaA